MIEDVREICSNQELYEDDLRQDLLDRALNLEEDYCPDDQFNDGEGGYPEWMDDIGEDEKKDDDDVSEQDDNQHVEN